MSLIYPLIIYITQPCQSLFVAPCSHTWHYKCIRVIINGPNWPHFICPNCRTVADLEAELDDPYADGEWEEADSSDVGAPTQLSDYPEVAPASQDPHQQQISSDATHVRLEGAGVDAEQDRSAPCDHNVADARDNAKSNQSIFTATDQLGRLNLEEPSPSSGSSSSQAEATSSFTVAPVNIISRRPVAGLSSQLEQSVSDSDRDVARTPSPTGLLSDSSIGPEGPMTPRNDAGPFIFDGSAGRNPETRLDSVTSNLSTANDTSLQPEHSTSS